MKIGVGDTVRCRLFNVPEGKFYGDTFIANVIAVNTSDPRGRCYRVKRADNEYEISLSRKEIKGRTK